MYLRVGDGSQPFFFQLVDSLLVFPQVKLGSYQDNWYFWTVMVNLWVPLSFHIFQACWIVQGEADKEDVCLWIREIERGLSLS